MRPHDRAHAGETGVVGRLPPLDESARAPPSDIPTVTKRPRLPVDDDKESDGAQADEELLAGSCVRAGPGNV